MDEPSNNVDVTTTVVLILAYYFSVTKVTNVKKYRPTEKFTIIIPVEVEETTSVV